MDHDGDQLALTLGAAVRDGVTVTPTGESTTGLLDGMSVHRSRTHTDARGTVTEMIDPRWAWHPDPVVTAYYITERPGRAKGWALHKEHEDRYFLIRGEVQLVVYDVRPGSSTRGEVRTLALSERDHLIVNIPAYVWHASRTLGETDAIIVNFPTQPYDHANPDKYRLPLDTPLIPYSFGDATGW